MRPHVADLPINGLEVLGSADQVIQQVPDLLLIEVLGNGPAILNLLREEIGEVLIVDLHNDGFTFALPVLPHHPLGWYSCLIGSMRPSLL